MTDKTKSKISSFVSGTGLLLAAPFFAVGGLIVWPLISLSEKIHTCQYGYAKYDAEEFEWYRICRTCGHKIISVED
jgi:hypothetical protein